MIQNTRFCVDAAATITAEQASRRAWDVVVVGAGPAGALAAREVALRGAEVLLVDKSAFPRWKVCGGCLNGTALATLQRAGLGDLPQQLGARPLNRWRFYAPAGEVACALPAGVSLSREAFDAALVAAAIDAGVSFLPETAAEWLAHAESPKSIQMGTTHASQTEMLRTSIVIVADGLSGRLLDGQPEFKVSIAPSARLGAGTIIADAPEYFVDGTIFMASGRGGYVGLARLEDGRLDVAAAFDRNHVRSAGGPADAAASILAAANVPMPARLKDAVWRGTPPLTRRRANVAGERIFVIGDAAGYVEPFTGEGIAWALQSALCVAPLAAEAAHGWSPEFARRWTKLHRNLVARRQRHCRCLGAVLKHPMLTTGVVRSLARFPTLAAPLIRAISAHPKESPRSDASSMRDLRQAGGAAGSVCR